MPNFHFPSLFYFHWLYPAFSINPNFIVSLLMGIVPLLLDGVHTSPASRCLASSRPALASKWICYPVTDP